MAGTRPAMTALGKFSPNTPLSCPPLWRVPTSFRHHGKQVVDGRNTSGYDSLGELYIPTQRRHARPCGGYPRLSGSMANKSWMAGTRPAMTALGNCTSQHNAVMPALVAGIHVCPAPWQTSRGWPEHVRPSQPWENLAPTHPCHALVAGIHVCPAPLQTSRGWPEHVRP